MADDPTLVAVMALAIADCEAAGPLTLTAARVVASAALAAINVSGTHWVVPVEMTNEMVGAYLREHEGEDYVMSRDIWLAMRIAYLAKTEETK